MDWMNYSHIGKVIWEAVSIFVGVIFAPIGLIGLVLFAFLWSFIAPVGSLLLGAVSSAVYGVEAHKHHLIGGR